MRARRHLLWLAAGVLLGAGTARAVQEASFLGLNGNSWRGFNSTERLVWMQGFLTGQAVRGVPDSLRGDSAHFGAELERQRRAGEFRYPYAPALYVNRLSDHYVWENHHAQPLWWGMMEIEASGER